MKNKILFIAYLLFDVVNMLIGMMQISWVLPLIAAAEIAGRALFPIRKFRALGVILLSPILAGILLIHLTVLPSGLPMVIVFMGIYIWVVAENREKCFSLVKS
jgi:putative oxidoreductase